MPIRDAEKRREANKRAQRRRREGMTDAAPLSPPPSQGMTGPRASPPAASPPDVTPDGRVIQVINWTDAEGEARVTRYCDPLANWRGEGYCRDCNLAVRAGSNTCGCEVL